MRTPLVRIPLVIAAIALAACLGSAQPAAAADRTIVLFGDDNAPGWGPDLGNITNPGPTLTVDLGDNVTLMLTGADNTNLRWYIDYDDDSTHDANEPRSPQFRNTPTPVQWNFTADTPWIGITRGPCASHARATCATVFERAFAIPRRTRRTFSASRRLLSEKRSFCFRMVSFGFFPGRYLSARTPWARGLHARTAIFSL